MKQFPVLQLLAFLLLSHFAFAQDANKMTAHFINVGQADATLLEFPCGAILIDAGAQGAAQEEHLVAYLKSFFERRTDLHKTLDLVIVTHAHIDHNLALDNVAKAFTIKRYIDNGLKVGSGKKNQNWLRDNAKKMGITYSTYSYEQISAGGNTEGVTDTIIDPLHCDEVDPEIVLLSGRFTRKPAEWSATDYENGNNHSVVIKVNFGESSFLFTGDLEKDGIEKLLSTYDASLLDVDVLRVGHHGAANATTNNYLAAVTPGYAVISCGKWNYGKTGGQFNTYSYGHPRVSTLKQLAESIEEKRSTPRSVKAGIAAKQFINYTVRKRVYATPWDKTVQIATDDEGNYTVGINH